jgi:hypothetical protein
MQIFHFGLHKYTLPENLIFIYSHTYTITHENPSLHVWR